jgi:predicted DNA-binding ribbon-helix-helix protein
MAEQNKQPRQEVGISFKVFNQFYKQLKIRATEEETTIKDFIIKLIEKELGTKNE